MPHSTRWSSASAPCRLEWRPSRWVISALLALALLAPLAVLASEIPRALAWSMAVGACLHGLWSARREWRRAPLRIVIAADGSASIDGVAIADFEVHWRGPFAFLRWRGAAGHWQRLGFWPDTLPAPQRRELRLAAMAIPAASDSAGMAH